MIHLVEKIYETGATIREPRFGLIYLRSPVAGKLKSFEIWFAGALTGGGFKEALFGLRVNGSDVVDEGSLVSLNTTNGFHNSATGLSTDVAVGDIILLDCHSMFTPGSLATPCVLVLTIDDQVHNLIGPSSSTTNHIMLFDGVDGQLAKDSDIVISTDGTLSSNSDEKIATEKATKTYADAVKSYADGLVVGLLDDRGTYDASGNTFPSSGGSGAAGAIKKGDIWNITVAGTLGGTDVHIGDWIRALVDTPGSTSGNWSILPKAGVAGATQLVDLTDVDLTGLADGDTLVWDAGSSLWVPGTPSGGGGGSGLYSPDVPYAVPSTEDDEFNAGSLNAKWLTNTNAPVTSFGVPNLMGIRPGHATQMSGLYQAVSDVDQTWRMKLFIPPTLTSNMNVGFLLRDSGTYYVTFYHSCGTSTGYFHHDYWINTNSVYSNNNFGTMPGLTSMFPPIYLEVQYVSSTKKYYYAVSVDGLSFYRFGNEGTVGGGALDRIGIFCNGDSTSSNESELVHIEWFRKLQGSYTGRNA
jgi:hypothetical protein